MHESYFVKSINDKSIQTKVENLDERTNEKVRHKLKIERNNDNNNGNQNVERRKEKNANDNSAVHMSRKFSVRNRFIVSLLLIRMLLCMRYIISL